MNNYYCLVAGLPDLSIDDGKLNYSVADFKENIYPLLAKKDQQIIDIFYLQYDNVNLLALLKDKDAAIAEIRGNYSPEELAALITSVTDGDARSKKYPAYLYDFIEFYQKNNASGEWASLLPEDTLSAYYYHFAMQCSNCFVSSWFEFNLNLNNLFAAMTARKYKLDLSSYIIGSTEICDTIRTSTARDFGLTGIFDQYEHAYHIAEITDLVEKEKKIDLLKWDWMEDASFFNYFTVEKLYVFLVKIALIERWISLDKEKGNEMFRQIIESLKNEVSIPNEFRK